MGVDDTGPNGPYIRELREGQGLSLRDLAAKCSVSASLLSQVERGVTTPSIQTLRAIAEALDASIFDLLSPAGTQTQVVQANRRRRVVLEEEHLRYELLSPNGARRLQVWMGRLDPGMSSGEEPSTHDTEEFIHVLSGRMRLEFASEVFELGPGDSVQYDGSMPHQILSVGDSKLEFISALSPAAL